MVELPNNDVRETVLKAALELLGDEGVRGLAGNRVAAKAGVRQSHLTYYFPRRSDLIGAVARRYIESAGLEMMELIAAAGPKNGGADLGQLLTAFAYKQVGDRRRTRTLVGLLVASEEDPALRAQMIEAVTALRAVIALAIGVKPDHPRAAILQATLWGLGINNLLMGNADLKELVDHLAKEMKPVRRKKRR